MSTSGEQAGRPLTRRELRELRAKGGEQAVREALDAAASLRAFEDAPDHQVVASAPSAGDEHPPLTRKELRRLRTNEVPVVTPELEAAHRDDAEEPVDLDHVSDESVEADEAADAPSDREERIDREDADDADNGDAEVDVPEHPEPEVADDETEDGEVAVEDTATEPSSESGSVLHPAFGADVPVSGPHTGRGSFDDLMEQSVSTSPSSIIMTSSHRLPEGLGSTGAARGTTDGRDVDAVLIDGELPPSSSPTPIAASEAISTQKSASDVIRPPSPERGRGLLLTLGITAGVLGIVAIGTLATLYFTGVFDQ